RVEYNILPVSAELVTKIANATAAAKERMTADAIGTSTSLCESKLPSTVVT
ncbi:hypothetical protein BaRGS_00036337, partial [Batillaria attramentaria]